jgi:opacity protein-like surface antigen
MNTRLLLAFSTVAIAVATPARAQLPVHLGITAGASIPQSDLSDAADMGYNAGATLTIAPPLLPISLRGAVSLNSFAMKDPGTVAGTTTSGDYRVIGGTASLVYSLPLPLPVKPYVLGGGGLYSINESKTTTSSGVSATTNKSSSRAGFDAGVGLRVGLLPMHPSIEARYVHIGGDKSKGETPMTFVPITFGLSF